MELFIAAAFWILGTCGQPSAAPQCSVQSTVQSSVSNVTSRFEDTAHRPYPSF